LDDLNRRWRRFWAGVQYIIYIKDSEGIILVSAHASTLYRLYFQPNLT